MSPSCVNISHGLAVFPSICFSCVCGSVTAFASLRHSSKRRQCGRGVGVGGWVWDYRPSLSLAPLEKDPALNEETLHFPSPLSPLLRYLLRRERQSRRTRSTTRPSFPQWRRTHGGRRARSVNLMGTPTTTPTNQVFFLDHSCDQRAKQGQCPAAALYTLRSTGCLYLAPLELFFGGETT